MKFMIGATLFGEADMGLRHLGKWRVPQSRGDADGVGQLAAGIVGRRYGHKIASSPSPSSDTPRSNGTPSDPSPRATQGPSRWAWDLALTCWSLERLVPHLRGGLAFLFDVVLPLLSQLP